MNNSISPKTFWQTALSFTFAFNAAMLIWSISRWIELKVILYRSVWGIALILYVVILIGCIVLFNLIDRKHPIIDRWIEQIELPNLSSALWQIGGWIIFSGVVCIIPYLKFTYRIGEVVKKSTQDPILSMIIFFWLVWWLILIAAGSIKVALRTSWAGGFVSALIMLGIAYELFLRFQAVTAYPLSLGWSEASRYYYASLYFSKSIYGEAIPLSTLHPTRYFLQSLAFLVSDDLTFHRLWQVILWITLTGGAAWVIAQRAISPSPSGRGVGVRELFAGWLFLFFLRVGVYYHLEIMVIVPVLFVSSKHPWRLLIAVIFASLWAGVSRVNWFPVPAMIAIAIYFIEESVESKNIFRYLGQPVLWTVSGLLSALLAQTIYIPLSGNVENAKAFTSSFTSDLLWYRLMPNELYPLGILPAILIVSFPLIAIILRVNRKAIHPIRWMGLIAMIILLFAGSLVVSTKIGGGGDLHNMDAYAALISVVSALMIGSRMRGEDRSLQRVSISWSVIALAALIPVVFLIPSLMPYPRYNAGANQAARDQLIALVNAAAKDGPVLFINERELITFGFVNADLVPEYEAVTLMEMAMSGNADYMNRFYDDLKHLRFAAIAAGKQNLTIKDEGAFAEENNVWNTKVSPYLLCYYEPVALLEGDRSRIEFFVPRFGDKDCDLP
jgi:hypothetical protein